MGALSENPRLQCRVCLGQTNHSVLYSKKTSNRVEYDEGEQEQYGTDYGVETTYSLVQCLGCEDVRLHVWSVEDFQGIEFDNVNFYPPNQIRHLPDWVILGLHSGPRILGRPEKGEGLREFLATVQKLLREIYQALGGGSYRLAMMGIRALIEQIMIQEVGDRTSIEANIRAFFDKGHIAESQRAIFKEVLVDAGNAAMHRGWEPKQDDVIILLDILEPLVRSLYIDPVKAAEVARSIPPRAWNPKKRS